MNIKELRQRLGITQNEFAERYHIPFRTIQNWETGTRKPPEYIIELLGEKVSLDLINRKTSVLPAYSSFKPDLPKRSAYVGALSWLRAVRECLGESTVFALDQALMCQGNFGGRSDEYIVWAYGDESLTRYNGVVLLGNQVSSYSVQEKNGLRFTDFNRTVSDAFANESILDMQGITEAVSRYYYSNDNSFDGIAVSPEYQDRFEKLANEPIAYYDN